MFGADSAQVFRNGDTRHPRLFPATGREFPFGAKFAFHVSETGDRRRFTGVNTREQTLPEFAVTADEPETDRAFEDLFLAHYPRLARTLARLVSNPAQAEEIAADAFCKLYRQRGRPFRHENDAGWVYRTAINLALDALRSDARRTRREQRTCRERLWPQTTDDPLKGLLDRERRDRVRLVLSQLKPLHAQVLLLSSSGYSPKEISEVVGVRIDSLYVLIARAKAHFEKKYVRLYGRTE